MADSFKQRAYTLGDSSINEVGEQLITWFQFTPLFGHGRQISGESIHYYQITWHLCLHDV